MTLNEATLLSQGHSRRGLTASGELSADNLSSSRRNRFFGPEYGVWVVQTNTNTENLGVIRAKIGWKAEMVLWARRLGLLMDKPMSC